MEKFSILCSKENYIYLLNGQARYFSRRFLASDQKGLKIEVILRMFEQMKRNGFDIDVSTYNTILKVMARKGFLGMMLEYYGEMLQNRIFPNVDTALYFALAISKKMLKEDQVKPFLPFLSHNSDPSSVLQLINDMLLRQISHKYPSSTSDDERFIMKTIRRDFGIQDLSPKVIRDAISKIQHDDECESAIEIAPVTSGFLFDVDQQSNLLSDFNGEELKIKAYTLLIVELCQGNQVELVKEKFKEMIDDGITPSSHIYSVIMFMFGRNNDLESLNLYLNDMRKR